MRRINCKYTFDTGHSVKEYEYIKFSRMRVGAGHGNLEFRYMDRNTYTYYLH